MENILRRHPKIKFIFAHLYFMSAQLPRLSEFLDRYPNVMVDMTPGLDIYVNFSKNPQEANAFLERYQDRILYGTDIGARCVSASNRQPLHEGESLARIEMIDGLLRGNQETELVEDGRYLINTDPFVLRGLDLSEDVLNKIYGQNFLRYVGSKPAAVSPKRIIKECRRILLMLKIMSFINKKLVPDTTVAKDAIAFFKKR